MCFKFTILPRWVEGMVLHFTLKFNEYFECRHISITLFQGSCAFMGVMIGTDIATWCNVAQFYFIFDQFLFIGKILQLQTHIMFHSGCQVLYIPKLIQGTWPSWACSWKGRQFPIWWIRDNANVPFTHLVLIEKEWAFLPAIPWSFFFSL